MRATNVVNLPYQISDAQLRCMEDDYIMTQSAIRPSVSYGVRRDGQGFIIVDAHNKVTSEIAFHADIIPYLREAMEVLDGIYTGPTKAYQHEQDKENKGTRKGRLIFWAGELPKEG